MANALTDMTRFSVSSRRAVRTRGAGWRHTLALVVLLLASTPALSALEQRVPGGQIQRSRAYLIDSNCSPEQIRALATVLDAMFNDFQRRFGSAVRIQQRMTVRFFATHEAYLAYGREYCNNFTETWDGYYFYAHDPAYREMVLYVQDEDGHMDTAVHEGFHQFMHAGINGLGRLPQWFNEGAAEYFERATLDKRGRFQLATELSYQWTNELRTLMAENRIVPLERLMQVTLSDWNRDGELRRNYASAYAFIHFLAETEHREVRALVALMRALAADMAYDRALAGTFGRSDLAELETEFHTWLAAKLEATSSD